MSTGRMERQPAYVRRRRRYCHLNRPSGSVMLWYGARLMSRVPSVSTTGHGRILRE